MTDEAPISAKEFYISCSRFGGRRYALSCVHFDKYRTCRRRCVGLQLLLNNTPEFLEKSKEYFKERDLKREGLLIKTFFDMKHEHSGKQLPDPHLACNFCNFIAKTERGLRIHRKRSHKR
jgi:hypothetical protein